MKLADKSLCAGRVKVGFVLARAFTLSAFALFVDTLRLASDEADQSGRIYADWEVLGSNGLLVKSSCGVQVAPTSQFVDPCLFDYVVVVGGLLNTELPVDDDTVSYLKRVAAKEVPLIGICTGTFILAACGLMRSHQTCVSWLHYKEFRRRFPDHEVRADRLFNLDRARGSCAGGSSAADMAALIVRRHISERAEKNALEVLQIEKARSSLDVQPRRPLLIESGDHRLRAVMIMMENNIEKIISIAKLAAYVGLSRRQLERLFMKETNNSPAIMYKRIRLDQAKRLLMQTKAPIIEIAVEVGFENASHFSRLFRQIYGKPPSEFRARAQRVE
jgi:transcriptional regulator GlxA family with amidase domain